MPVHKVANDADFTEKLNQGGTKLIVVDFSAAWLVISHLLATEIQFLKVWKKIRVYVKELMLNILSC